MNEIIFIDLEMTGLNVEVDEIVEIAVIITDSKLNIIDKGISLVVKPSEKAMANMNNFVFKMHKKSKLLPEIHKGISITEAEKIVMKYIKDFIPPESRPILSGNSISTDRKFIDVYMPKLGEYLQYRMIDISSVKELAKRWNPKVYYARPEKNGDHRAYDDIFDSINELKHYKENFFILDSSTDYTFESKDDSKNNL